MSDPLHLWSAQHLLVCVPATLAGDVAGALRARLLGEPSVDGVLEVLTAGGMAATPPFVCASVEEAGVRVVIRGELAVVAHGRDGSSLTLGAGRAATWNDDVVTDIERLSVDVGGSRFEWVTGRPAGEPTVAQVAVPEAQPRPRPRPQPEPAPVRGDPPPESHTLDEAEFERVVATSPEARPASEPDGGPDFSSLLEDTSHRAATSGTAVRSPISSVPPSGTVAPTPPPAAPAPPARPGTGLGEHDGRTVTLADLRRIQEQAGTAPPPASGDGATGPRSGTVRAVRCPQGHASPPTATTCRLCEAPITDAEVVSIPRPVVARLVFESGLVVDVDRPQLIGRRPSAPPEADEIPNLVTVPSPDGDISRAHTAVRVEGWDVLVEDVGSTNGTEVRLPSREPMRMREHDPVLVVPGTEVTMAGTIRFRVEGPEA